jgi:pectinesterase
MNPHAIVDRHYAGAPGANVNSIKLYTQVASALDDVPNDLTVPYIILIKNGRYYEKLTIDKPLITLIGESQDRTILTFDDAADTKKPDGTTYGTFGSASVSILAREVCLENLTIENSFDFPANAAKASYDPTRFKNTQAVALRINQASDCVILKNVALVGYHDTLLVNAGRSYFQHCYITGHIDFIFGAGQAVFDDCDLVSRDRGYITAASTLLSNAYGFLFVDCRLKKALPELADASVALGRPWHPTTLWADGTRSANPNAVGCVVFKNCWMDSHIIAPGWERMHGWDKDGKQIWFYPQDARFFEYGSTGPGALQHPARHVLSESEAPKYTIENVLGGWKPAEK